MHGRICENITAKAYNVGDNVWMITYKLVKDLLFIRNLSPCIQWNFILSYILIDI